MTRRILTFALLGGGVALVAVLFWIGLAIFLDRNMVYPTPQNQSAFLTSYDLGSAVTPFVVAPAPNRGAWKVGEAEEYAVKLQRGVTESFYMQAQDRDALSAAVRQDVIAQLENAGAQVTDTSRSEDGGFRVAYTLTNAVGTALIKPLEILGPDKIGPCLSPAGLSVEFPVSGCSGAEGARVTVVIDEKFHGQPGRS